MDENLEKLTAWDRILSVIDEDDEFNPIYDGLSPKNLLDIPDYDKKLENAQKLTKLEDSILTGIGIVGGVTCAIGAMDYRFLCGSLGSVSGEKIANLIEIAGRGGYPLIIFCCSGGARMQEGIYSLMQMSKIVTTLAKYKEQIPIYISILTNPTMGGVTASFGMLGDIILAEPDATIGFAGPKVIEPLIKEKIPKDFQSAENQLKNGFIDAVVPRDQLKNTLDLLIKSTKYQVLDKDTSTVEFDLVNYQEDVWQKIKGIRSFERLDNKDYISKLFNNFIELHGDRVSGDDPTIYGGIAYFRDIPVTVISITKGHNTDEIIKNKFGMVSPEGYRKAIRLLKLHPSRPVIIFVNTPGAYPGILAEEKGQGTAIANCLLAMADVTAPTLSFITGEGGSGGALALATSNCVWMLENSVYSVISPEGFASILFKDVNRAPEAAKLMRMTSKDLLEAEVIDGIIPEHGGATMEHLDEIVKDMATVIGNFIRKSHDKSGKTIVDAKHQKFSKF